MSPGMPFYEANRFGGDWDEMRADFDVAKANNVAWEFGRKLIFVYMQAERRDMGHFVMRDLYTLEKSHVTR